MMQSS